MLPGGPFTEQVAGDHDARRDADTRREVFDARRRADGRDGAEARKRRAYAPLRVVLVRHREAEVRDHAIAQVLGDVAVEARDFADDRILVRADHATQVFRIELARKRGRADEVHEHHGQMPAFRPARGGRPVGAGEGARSSILGEPRDRLEELRPRTEWNPELF